MIWSDEYNHLYDTLIAVIVGLNSITIPFKTYPTKFGSGFLKVLKFDYLKIQLELILKS